MFSSSRSLGDVREGSVPLNFASSRNRRQLRESSGYHRPARSSGIINPTPASPIAKKLHDTPPSILRSSRLASSKIQARSNRFKRSRSASPVTRPSQTVNPLDSPSSASQSTSRIILPASPAYLNGFGNPPPDCSVTSCSRKITFSSPSISNGYAPSSESSITSYGLSRAQRASPPPDLTEAPFVTAPSLPDLRDANRVHQKCDKSSAKDVEYAFNSSRYGETFANYNARLGLRRPTYGFGLSSNRPRGFESSRDQRNHPFRKSGSMGDVSEALDNFDSSNYGQWNNKKRPKTLARMTKDITKGMSAFYFEDGEN